MTTIEQWQMTLRWSFKLTLGFFAIYAAGTAVNALFLYQQFNEVVPDQMKRNYLEMVFMGPVLFGGLFFVLSFVLLRTLFLIIGLLNHWNSTNAVTPIR